MGKKLVANENITFSRKDLENWNQDDIQKTEEDQITAAAVVPKL